MTRSPSRIVRGEELLLAAAAPSCAASLPRVGGSRNRGNMAIEQAFLGEIQGESVLSLGSTRMIA